MLTFSPSPPASPGECHTLLDSFLDDMVVLDSVQEVPAHDREVAASKRSSSASQTKTKTKREIKQKKRKNPWWLKRKSELHSLRTQVQETESRLASLQLNLPVVRGSFVVVDEKQKKARLNALVERRRCQAAKDENTRLREKLEAYMGQADKLQTVLTNSQSQDNEMMRTSMALTRTLRVEMGAGQQLRLNLSYLFDVLETKVNDRFRELDESFKLIQEPIKGLDTELVETFHQDESAVEFSFLRMLPFEEDVISSAAWSIIEAGRFPDGQPSVVVRRSNDVYAKTSRMTVDLGSGGTVVLDTQSVLKRFMTPSGFAILSESCSSWTASSSTLGNWSHETREGGCFVMRQYSQEACSGPSICRIESVIRLKPSDIIQEVNCTSIMKPENINEVVVLSFRKLFSARHQFMENVVFDSIRQRTLTPPDECQALVDSFLDDMETLDSVQETTAPYNATLPCLTAVKKPKKTRQEKKRLNPWWLKRKNELQTLRAQVQEMESQLASLQLSRPVMDGNIVVKDEKQQKARTIALVERQRCQTSQDENIQLKKRLKVCTGKANALQTALTTFQSQENELVRTSMELTRALRVEMEAGQQLRVCSSAVFDKFEGKVDARFRELDEIFKFMQNPVTSMDSGVVQRSYSEGGHEVGGVELSRLQLVPFDQDAIIATIWSFVEVGRVPDGQISIVVRRSADVFALNSRITLQLADGTVNLYTCSVMKRFVPANGFAIMASLARSGTHISD